MRRREFYLSLSGALMIIILFSGCVSQPPEGVTKTPMVTSTSKTTSSVPIQTTPSSPTQPPTKETSRVTIKVVDTDGNPLNGIIGFEKGFVHKGRFFRGTRFYNGLATIDIPKVRDIPEVEWNYFGMHVYATGYLYFPDEKLIIPGQDYEYEVALAPEPNPDDDPVISKIEFSKESSGTSIQVEITSPINNLGPQDLALNSKTGEMIVLNPPSPVASIRDIHPNGVYTTTYPDPNTNPMDWYFVVADEGCSNGPIQGYPLNENIIPARSGVQGPSLTKTPTGPPENRGLDLVSAKGCVNCHYFDRESTFEGKEARTNWKVGPGLKGLFKKELLPATGRPATEENVRKQIREGGGGMPAFSGLSEEEVSNIIAYLKSI